MDETDKLVEHNDNLTGFKETAEKKEVTVLVLGDLGHSPRMGYHALSFAKEDFKVNFMGYRGSTPQKEIINNKNISLFYLKHVPDFFTRIFPRPVTLIIKAIWQSFVLFISLLSHSSPQILLVQNPPSVPALPVCWFYCLLTGCHFYIDWHNYGHSIMELSFGKKNIIVTLYEYIEIFFGRLSKGGFCVTEQMRKDLLLNFKMKNIKVHYDKPHSRFHPITDDEKHYFFLKLSEVYSCFSGNAPDKSIFTERFASEKINFNEDRPALLVSSTSWTKDEDFSILLYALNDYERVREEFPCHYPQLIVVITGKGPLKSYYIDEIEKREWRHVLVITPWLEAEDYPKLLASADLGISLHFSSSGLDLPMKVVDMFGCGLPVMAINYRSLPELVKHNKNGFIFDTQNDLANLLQDWFRGFPNETEIKKEFLCVKANIDEFRETTWDASWVDNVLPMFSE